MAADESRHRVKQLLVEILWELAQEKRTRLEELKIAEQENVKREDWVWHALLEANASQGNNRGYEGLILTPANYARVAWDALRQVKRSDRLAAIEAGLRAGSVRMPARKAGFLDDNYDMIESMGGPAEAKRRLFGAAGREGKMTFLKAFKGIGDKYARNIMMNLHHPDFRDSIAIDERIKKVSEAAGLTFDTFEEHEGFYLGVAREAGLEGWEVDRLIFHFATEVMAQLGGGGLQKGAQPPCSGTEPSSRAVASAPRTPPVAAVTLDALGPLEAGAALTWHKVGGEQKSVTYVRTEKQRIMVHEFVGTKVLLRALPPWMLTRA